MNKIDEEIKKGIARLWTVIESSLYDSQDDDDKEFDELIKGLSIDLDKDLELFPFENDDKLEKTKEICTHPKKYLNKISNSLQFWYCPDCKREVKDDE